MTPMPEAGAQEAPITHRRVLSPRRRGLRRGKGQAMVEFALIAPAGFLLLLSILVVGILVTNYIQLANAARDGARVAAICGSSATAQMTDNSGNTQACTPANVASYITAHLVALPAGSVTPQIYFCTSAEVQSGTCAVPANLLSSTATAFTQCQTGAIFEIDMYYDQPLYLPLVGNFFQTSPNNTRRLTASAEATCEQ
jgi:Flp pilus assembly protein TadG